MSEYDIFSDIEVKGVSEVKEVIPKQLNNIAELRINNLKISFRDYGRRIEKSNHLKDRFLDEINKYKINRVDEVFFCDYVKVDRYCYSFNDMTMEQIKWYIYFRKQINDNKYIKSDKHYIDLYTKELICGSIKMSNYDIVKKLIELLKHYDDLINTDLPKVILALIIINDIGYIIDDELVELYYKRNNRLSFSLFNNVILDYYVKSDRFTPSFELVSKIAMDIYNVKNSRFYLDGNKSIVEKIVPKVICLVDDYYKRTHKKGIVKVFMPQAKKDYYCGGYFDKYYVSVEEYDNKEFRMFIANIVKFSENTMRKALNYKGRVPIISFEEELSSLIEEIINKELETSIKKLVDIEYDLELISSIKKEYMSTHCENSEIFISSKDYSIKVNKNSNLDSNYYSLMKKYEDIVGTKVDFVEFTGYWSNRITYNDLTKSQLDWYFYMRSQIKKGNYIDTDLSYIFGFIYEIMNEIGVSSTCESFKLIKLIWENYIERHYKLNNYIPDILLELLMKNNVDFKLIGNQEKILISSEFGNFEIYRKNFPKIVKDFIYDCYQSNNSIQLPISVIKEIADYKLEKSKFFNDGNAKLVEEAITKVVALADLYFKKTQGVRFLNAEDKMNEMFSMFFCYINIELPNYQNAVIKNRNFINTIIKYSENVLRGIKGYKNKLDVKMDNELGILIEEFLNENYGYLKPIKILDIRKNPDNNTLEDISSDFKLINNKINISSINEYIYFINTEDLVEQTFEYVSFNAKKPMFENLDKSQQSWYAYFREELNKNNFIDSDKGYIILYVYEVINGQGWNHPSDGVDKLTLIWLSYREKYREFDDYMPDWILDFAVIHKTNYYLPKDLSKFKIFKKNQYYFSNIMEIYFRNNFSKIPLYILDEFSDFSILKNNLYKQNGQLVENVIEKILSIVELYYIKNYDESFLDAMFKQSSYTKKHILFENTRYFKDKYYLVYENKNFLQNKDFIKLLTQIIKYTFSYLQKVLFGNIISNEIDFDMELKNEISEFLYSEYNLLDNKYLTKKDGEKAVIEFVCLSNKISKGDKFVDKVEMFFVDIEKFKDTKGFSCTYLTFDAKNPTYNDMDRGQFEYYLFFRSQAQQGNYIKTNMTYILVYVYEIINVVGWENPNEGLILLNNIWQNYKNQFNEINDFLPMWILDFAIINNVNYYIPYTIKTLKFNKKTKFFSNKLIESYFLDSCEINPLIFIENLDNYKKYKAYKLDADKFEEALISVTDISNTYYKGKYQKNILEHLSSSEKYSTVHYFFKGGIRRNINHSVYVEINNYIDDSKIIDFFVSLVNTIECFIFGETLEDAIELEKELYDVIIEELKIIYSDIGFINTKISYRNTLSDKLALNFNDIEKIRKQSDLVRESLEVLENEDIPKKFAQQISSNIGNEEVEYNYNLDLLESDLRLFFENLKEYQVEILKVIFCEKETNKRLEEVAKEKLTLTQILIDEINTLSVEYIADIIIDDNFCIVEEYKLDLSIIFENKG